MNKNLMMQRKYTNEEYMSGQIPKDRLEDKNAYIILSGGKELCLIKDNIKCNFILMGSGMYDIGGKREVIIDSTYISLIARNKVTVIDRDSYEHHTNNITLMNESKMKSLSSNFTYFSEDNECTRIIMYDNSYIETHNGYYDICMRNNSTGFLSGHLNHLILHDNAYVRLNKVYSKQLEICCWDTSKLDGVLEHNYIKIYGHENSKINIFGTCIVIGTDHCDIIARGNIHVKVYDYSNTIHAYYKCLVDIAHSALLDNIKIYGNSVIRYSIITCSISTINKWIEYFGTDINHNKYINRNKEVVLYKAVSEEYKTQEGTENETLWLPGTTVEMPMNQWNPDKEECGEGKFHACGNPMDCLEFRNNNDDKFIAIKVNKKDLFLWISHSNKTGKNLSYPNKIAFRKGKVLYECDMSGNKIENKE